MDSWIYASQSAKEGLKKRAVCGNLSEDNTYDTCGDKNRNNQVICVVQSPKDVIAIKRTKEYSGVYRVPNGVTLTSKGILPEDINIDSLLNRISGETEEIAIATNPTVEGETTVLYLSKLLEKYPVIVTRIARGLPMGGHLDYADELALIKATERRKKMEP